MKKLFFTLLCIILILPASASAQGVVEVTSQSISYTFGNQVTFQASMKTASPIKDAMIFFLAQGETSTRVDKATVTAGNQVSYTYLISTGPLRPFAQVYFWYQVNLENGQSLTTSKFSFDYTDNRFPWQTLENNSLRVHWYNGDIAFGQSAFDTANLGLENIQKMFPVNLSRPLDVYIYSTAADLQSTLQANGQSWVAGHASPDLGVVLVSITPGPEQGLSMDRQIPHELAHVLTYELTKEKYGLLPVWLKEGIASMAELSPNIDYGTALKQATEKETLLPLSDLCQSFPTDIGGAYLAYAQADSFTRYVVDQYGYPGLIKLIDVYGSGVGCEQGAAQALNEPLSQLENHWRQEKLGENRTWVMLGNLMPYFVILLVVLFTPFWSFLTMGKKS